MKKALAIISFGTAYKTGMRAICHMEEYMRNEWKEYDCFHAFTSEKVRKKLKEQKGIYIPTTNELLQELYENGYEEVICQPTYLMYGVEFEKIMAQVSLWKGKFSSLKLGNPILFEEEDYEKCLALYQKEISLKETEALVLVGHGSKTQDNRVYAHLDRILKEKGEERIYIGTLNGILPFEEIKEELKKKNYKKIWITPFMIVVGSHVYRDMIGTREQSWERRLKMEGYEVEVYAKGLGEYTEVARILASHIRKAREV